MQGFTLTAITGAEKTKLKFTKSMDHEIVRSRALGQGASLKGMSRTIHVTICKVSHSQLSQVQRKPNFDLKIYKVNGPSI